MAKKARRNDKARNHRTGIEAIPSAELDVLACLWRETPVTAARIREMLRPLRPMAHGSVVTLLMRLQKKGLVIRDKGAIGKAFLFRNKTPQEETRRRLAGEMLKRVFADDKLIMLKAILEASPIRTHERAAIAKLLSGKNNRPRP